MRNKGEKMKNSLKWLLMVIFRVLNAEAVVDLIIKLLRELAKKTENKVDDAAVEIIAEILYSAFGSDSKEKLAHLDEQFN